MDRGERIFVGLLLIGLITWVALTAPQQMGAAQSYHKVGYAPSEGWLFEDKWEVVDGPWKYTGVTQEGYVLDSTKYAYWEGRITFYELRFTYEDGELAGKSVYAWTASPPDDESWSWQTYREIGYAYGEGWQFEPAEAVEKNDWPRTGYKVEGLLINSPEKITLYERRWHEDPPYGKGLFDCGSSILNLCWGAVHLIYTDE
jgi:hypothetical protein